MNKSEIEKRGKDYISNHYSHGGSRIALDGESRDRQLIVDTYLDHDFAVYIDNCVRKYFNFKPR